MDDTVPTSFPRPVLIGLIGATIQASRSPALHMREGAAQGLAYIYRQIDLDRPGLDAEKLPQLLDAARYLGFTGLNVTHPCKQAVIPLLDELSADAEAIGAVNTVVFGRDGRTVGHNTDWFGFAQGARLELPDMPHERVVQLGAGGGGAAVAHALLMLGTRQLALFDTEAPRAASLAAHLNQRFPGERAIAIDGITDPLATADGLVNATPVGMIGHPGLALPASLLRPDLWVADIVYFPLETELLRAARALGCRTMGGGTMAVFQAVEAFRLFTGIEPDAARMLRHFASM
ncbi:MAG: shikimate dehydrogenase [Alphaproteobacteria bacterium]|nr:shikimate dehydrogenase [Alphaproteobacteria bacterium]